MRHDDPRWQAVGDHVSLVWGAMTEKAQEAAIDREDIWPSHYV